MTSGIPRSVMAAAVALALSAPASAQVFFEFADDITGTPRTTFTVPLGQTLRVRVYLHDFGVGAPILNANGGLQSAGVRVATSDTVRAAMGTADSSGLPWNGNTTSLSMLPVSSVANTLSFTAVRPDVLGRIYLTTVPVTGLALGTVTLTALDPNPVTDGNTSYFDPPFTGIDPLIQQATASFMVVPVPEPASWLMASLAVAGVARLRRRRAALAA